MFEANLFTVNTSSVNYVLRLFCQNYAGVVMEDTMKLKAGTAACSVNRHFNCILTSSILLFPLCCEQTESEVLKPLKMQKHEDMLSYALPEGTNP